MTKGVLRGVRNFLINLLSVPQRLFSLFRVFPLLFGFFEFQLLSERRL